MTKHILRHSGMVRQHQTRNLEIPGSMLRIARNDDMERSSLQRMTQHFTWLLPLFAFSPNMMNSL